MFRAPLLDGIALSTSAILLDEQKQIVLAGLPEMPCCHHEVLADSRKKTMTTIPIRSHPHVLMRHAHNTTTLLCTHGHPSLHSWSPFSALMVTLLCTHGHPSLHSWSPFSALMVTLLCTHGHPSLHSWSPFSALMVTLLCTHGHPSLHSWSPFSALMVTLLCTHGHPSLHSWSPFSCTHGHPFHTHIRTHTHITHTHNTHNTHTHTHTHTHTPIPAIPSTTHASRLDARKIGWDHANVSIPASKTWK